MTLADAINELLRRVQEGDFKPPPRTEREWEALKKSEVIKMLEELAKTLPREGEGLKEFIEKALKEGIVKITIR